MKAAVLWEIGKGPVWQEFEEPEAGEGESEALVRVRAASLKPVDKQLASGEHFASPREADLPVICGTDGVGTLEDGTRVKTSPAKIRLAEDGANPWYEVILIEGRNRQIRRMFQSVGFLVEKIKRVQLGPLVLDVPPGKYRALTVREVAKLKSL